MNKLRYMSRIVNYLIITGLFVVGFVAIKEAVKVEDKPKYRTDKIITRSATDSLAAKEYLITRSQIPTPDPIKWNEITSAIVALTVGVGSIWFKTTQSKVNTRLESIETVLQSVADQKNRDNVDNCLTRIEQDAAGFADDEKIKALIEGIGSRTRSFCRDVMRMDFNEEAYDKALLKIGARMQDGKHQVKDLGLSDYFATEMDKIRLANLKQLKIELGRLMKDHIHNSKYERFGDIICRFQKNYMKQVNKLGYECAKRDT